MVSLSSSSTEKKNNKVLSVKNQSRFKRSFLMSRENTILKKALELSILCDNEICVLHYDLEGNLVNTLPQDQSQVKDVLEKYNNLSDGEKIKKNTNLSQFCNKKLNDEKRRSLTDAEVHRKFTKKVGDFKGCLQDKLLMLKDMARDLVSSQDHYHQTTTTETDQSHCLDVMSEENNNFPVSSDFLLPNDFSSPLIEDPLSGDQYLMRPAVYNATNSSYQQSKYSVFMFNHETSTLTQLPNSVATPFHQSLTPYDNSLNNTHGFNFGCNNSLNTHGFNFGCNNNNLCT